MTYQTAGSFVCSSCEQVYDVDDGWTEQDAISEALDTLGTLAFTENMVSVCDKCYSEVIAYARAKGLLR